MSGAGSRFVAHGYSRPKPLIEFHGKSMIEHVLSNLGLDNTFILCVLRAHYDVDPVRFCRLTEQSAGMDIVLVDQPTQGAAETCLLAKKHIKLDQPLMIANCDQLMVWDQDHFTDWFDHSRLDGCMFTFWKDDPAYSYVEVDSDGIAIRTAEKQVISNHATTGIYVWARGGDFIRAAESMIEKDLRVNSEFYVCPVYNENIAWGAKIGIYEPQEHWPIGTPEDLRYYLERHPG
jgi:NDP-sugar pyrophosphorylase family protein